ncbi:MAG: type IV pilus assembly protein PilW [Candidatus Azotimanducaceae bacterium]|jgi:type IV pilus assembly protein PilW
MLKMFQKGLSLVELMISLVIGSVIMVGIVQLFSANSDTYSVMIGQSRMQESARFSLDFISRDIRKAGYSGCFSSNEQLYFTISDEADLPYEFDLRNGIQGYDASGVNLWSPNLDKLPKTIGATNTNVFVAGTGIDTDAILSGTDILTLRNVRQQDIENRLAVKMDTSQNPIRVVVPAGGVDGLGFKALDMALIHDCEKATVFHVTGIDTTTNPGEITVFHTMDPVDVWRNSFMTLALKNSFNDDAAVSGIETNTYFIGPGAGQNSSGDTPVSLWRKAGTSVPVELVEGVEDLQIRFGVSTDGDRVPNQYVLANEVISWTDVTTVRVTVVANTIDDVGGSSTPTQTCDIQTCLSGEPTNGIDGLMRRTFTQTIMLRNSS